MKKLIIDRQEAYAGTAPLPSQAQLELWLSTAAAHFEFTRTPELTVRLVNDGEIRQLNRDYRHKDYATNVLSFPAEADLPTESQLLGDLVIAADVVQREAAEQGKELWHHWAHLCVHGLLHLLGYDHQNDEEAEEMEGLEIEILAELAIANPYEE